MGAAIAIGFGFVDWSVRRLQDTGLRRRILLGNLVAVTLVAMVLLLGTTAGTINTLGWAGALFHAVLAAVVLVALLRMSQE